MATKNIVPRANNEGSIGTSVKSWASGYFNELNITGDAVGKTQSAKDNSIKLATTAYVDGAISDLVGAAPGTLDTLQELAAALDDDEDFAATMTTQLAGKVDKTSADYIKSASVSGNTLTLTQGNDNTVTFTDEEYTNGDGLDLSNNEFSVHPSTNVTVDSNGVSVVGTGSVASGNTGLISGGIAHTELRPTKDGTWVKGNQTTAVNLEQLERGVEYSYALLSRQYDEVRKYINGNYYDYDTDDDSAYTKTVPGGAMPYAGLEQIGGKTVVWNQQLNVGTITYAGSGVFATNAGATLVAGHKYYACVTITSENNTYLRIYTRANDTNTVEAAIYRDTPSLIFTATNDAVSNGTTSTTTNGNMWLYCTNSWTSVDSATNIMLIDLTLLYGTGNEPSTVAEFEAMFPADYYAYNAGTLLSAGVTSVVSKSLNLFNPAEATESGATISASGDDITVTASSNGNYKYVYMDVPRGNNTNVYVNFSATGTGDTTVRIGNVSADGTFVSWISAVTSPQTVSLNTSYPTIRIGLYAVMNVNSGVGKYVTYNKLQVEFGNTPTTYNPCVLQTYPIPASIQALEGYGWSAGSVYNYIDFERKMFVKNVGSVDLGTLNWTRDDTSYDYAFFVCGVSEIVGRRTGSANILSAPYITTDARNNMTTDKMCSRYNSTTSTRVVIRDDTYTDASTFTTAMDGVYMYYELATPIETDISAYLTDDNLISVESGGTLTFPNSNGDDYRLPVPSDETYMIDLQEAINNG